MRIAITLSDDLLAYADSEAERRGTTRSGLLSELLAEAKLQGERMAPISQHSWPSVEEEAAWRTYQRARMASEYAEDDW